MAHKSGNTSGVSKSSRDWLNYTGFPGNVCVAFFNVPSVNKDVVTPNPLTKEESFSEHLSGSTKRWISKVCEIFKVCSIESLKYAQEFYTPVCYCGDISTPQNVTLNESCHGFQTFSCQSEGCYVRLHLHHLKLQCRWKLWRIV